MPQSYLGLTTGGKGQCVPLETDSTPTGLQIGNSVGQGGRNDPGDVKKIQGALNRVPAGQGDPQPLLVEDGLVGPKTVSAIYKFQQHHFGAAKADGRVDPNQYTIAKLREFQQDQPVTPSAPPVVLAFGLSSSTLAKLELCKNKTIPVMERVRAGLFRAKVWNVEARNRLQESLKFLNGEPAFAKSMDLVDRCFKVKGLAPNVAKAAIMKLDGIFKKMVEVIDISLTPGEKSYFQEATSGCNPPGKPAPFAFTIPGDFSKKDPDNSAIYYCTKKIKSGDFSCDDLVDLTIHELAHFAGPGGADAIRHRGNKGGLDALTLPHDDAMHNASCYAWLAWLARLPKSQWLTNKG